MEITNFNELAVKEEITRAIADLGYEQPSPIQAKAIPVVLEGYDVIGQAYMLPDCGAHECGVASSDQIAD